MHFGKGNGQYRGKHFKTALQKMYTSVNGQQHLLEEATGELSSSSKAEITNRFSRCIELDT